MLNNPNSTGVESIGFSNCTSDVDTFSAGVAITLLPANAFRAYAVFQNVGNNGDITLYLGDALEPGEGIIVKPWGSYEINHNNLYIGKIMGISGYTSAQINFTECSK